MNVFSSFKGLGRSALGLLLTMDGAGPLAAAKASAPVAAEPAGNSNVTQSLARILRPAAGTRWLLPSMAAITPQYIESILRNALAGSHVQQWELFDLMLDTWPELAACAQELTCGVTRKKLIFEPYCEEGEKPSDSAQEKLRLISAALRRMRPRAASDENDLDGTLADLVDGWFRGVTVLEVDWQSVLLSGSQAVAPRCTVWAHPRFFAWGSDGTLGYVDAGEGMSGLNPATQVLPFPEDKFLIGIHKAKSGNALGGALLRPLAWWWCAANFSADWLMNLAQVFGLPFRWANYDPNAPQATIDAICTMLQNMGSAGWAAFPAGTTLEMKEASKGADHSPQGELLDRADRYARMMILGKTMSGSQSASKGGGKAFGDVEKEVTTERTDAAANYVTGILNTQLIPAILRQNYGTDDEAPTVRLLEDEEGSLEEAQRDQVLASAGLKIGEKFLRRKYDIPEPEPDEETIGGAVDTGLAKPDTGKSGTAKLPKDSTDDPAAAKDAALLRIARITDDALFCRALSDLAQSGIRNPQSEIS